MRFASGLVLGATITTIIAATWRLIIPWVLARGDTR